MNKIVTYDVINKQMNVPKFFNEQLEKIGTNENIDTITFIQIDLLNNLNEANKFIQAYLDLMQELDLPFTFFPYYSTFNRVLTDSLNFVNPKLMINANGKQYPVVIQPVYGLLILDVKKIKSINFKFDQAYPEIFYLQDLVEKCFQEKLWISNCAFIDICNSNSYLKDQKAKTYQINVQNFKKQQEEYNKIQRKYAPLQEFVDTFKKYLIDKNILIGENN